jgi:putative FmdB family regulatory protein
MPIYEYQCTACGHQLEALQKMSEDPLKECPQCHQQTLNKLVSAAGFQLKGSGWYVTDYSQKNKPGTEAKDSSKDSGKSESSETTKSTDTKSTDTKGGGSSSNNSSSSAASS